MRDTTEATRRAIGAFVPPRSELRRRSDRVEVAARWVLLLLGMLVVPVALAVGSEVAAGMAPQVAAQQAERHLVTGEVLAVPTDGDTDSSGTWRAPVRWTAADGTTRVADLRVSSAARPGDARPVWLDRADRPTTAPMPAERPGAEGVLTTLLIVFSDLVLSLLLLAGLRWVLDRARLREWEAAWRRFTGPDHESTR
ncbi:hypothetical protein GCM10023200_15960 [Actinomycetospora chlora]|uniref:Transmembrane protein n=1 Tax=Actinomycetospora chlora TaxID=663608 RepID=A0ABP9ANQ1_9PSEU